MLVYLKKKVSFSRMLDHYSFGYRYSGKIWLGVINNNFITLFFVFFRIFLYRFQMVLCNFYQNVMDTLFIYRPCKSHEYLKPRQGLIILLTEVQLFWIFKVFIVKVVSLLYIFPFIIRLTDSDYCLKRKYRDKVVF